MSKIRVLVCDDEKYLCSTYAERVNLEEDMECVGMASGGPDVLVKTLEKKPDVLLLDIQMETETAGIDIIPELKENCPKMKIILLTSYEYDNYIFKGLANGAEDYIVKTMTTSGIIDAIRNAFNETTVLDPKIMAVFRSKAREMSENRASLLYLVNGMIKLTKSELEILKAVYSGQNYRQIASDRFVTESTIKTLVSRILAKCEATNMKTLIKNIKELGAFDLFRQE